MEPRCHFFGGVLEEITESDEFVLTQDVVSIVGIEETVERGAIPET